MNCCTDFELSSSPFFRSVSFQLGFGLSDCDLPDHYNEGVEFSVQLENGGAWIPAAAFFAEDRDSMCGCTEPGEVVDGVLIVRGYRVEDTPVPQNTPFSSTLQVCGKGLDNSVSFRWLQTTSLVNDIPRDVWSLDDIEISYHDEDGEENVLLAESFNNNQLK